MAVGDHVRVKGIEGDCKKSGERSAKLFGPEKEYDTKEDGNESDGEAGEEEDGVSIVTGDFRSRAVHKHVPNGPLFVVAILPLRGLEGKSQFERQEREPDEILQKGRVFGIESHIAVTDVAISSRNMGLLIVGHRFLRGNDEGEYEVKQEHGCYQPSGVFFDPFHGSVRRKIILLENWGG